MEALSKAKIIDELEQLPDSCFSEILTFVRSLSQKDAERQTKLQAMREAAQDPLYLSDLREVEQDFAVIDHETL